MQGSPDETSQSKFIIADVRDVGPKP
jgi:hypothetical protein